METESDGYAVQDTARSGIENMAIDAALLNLAAERDLVLLRIYTWAEPTLSLGYFQPYQQRREHEPSGEIAVVRRATGGGAIVHHHELTYSVAVPDRWLAGENRLNASIGHRVGAAVALADALHGVVVEWLNQLGLPAYCWNKSCSHIEGDGVDKSPTPFLCFQRRSCGDVLIGNDKVLGSAQRRRRGAVLQHGSLLLRTSPYAPNLRGLDEISQDFSPVTVDAKDVCGQLMMGLNRILGCEVLLTSHLQDISNDWPDPETSQFAEEAWIRKR